MLTNMKKNIKKSDIFKNYQDKELSKLNKCLLEWYNYLKSINCIKEDINIKKKDCDCWFVIENIDILFKYINQKREKEKSFQYDNLYKIYLVIKRSYIGFTFNYFNGLTLNDINDYNLCFFVGNSYLQKLITYRRRTFRTDKIDNYTWLITHKKYYRLGRQKPSETKARTIDLNYNIFDEYGTCDANTFECIRKLKANLKKLNIYKLNDTLKDIILDEMSSSSISGSESSSISIILSDTDTSPPRIKNQKKEKFNKEIVIIDKTNDIASSSTSHLKNKKRSNKKLKNKKEEDDDEYIDSDDNTEKYSISNRNGKDDDDDYVPTPSYESVSSRDNLLFDTHKFQDGDYESVSSISSYKSKSKSKNKNKKKKNKKNKNSDNDETSIDYDFLKAKEKYNSKEYFENTVSTPQLNSVLTNSSFLTPTNSLVNFKYDKSSLTPLSSLNLGSESISSHTNSSIPNNRKSLKYKQVDKNKKSTYDISIDISNNSNLKKGTHSVDYLTTNYNTYTNPRCQRILDFTTADETGIHRIKNNINHNRINYNKLRSN